jgi:hypothetical protein
LALRGELTKLSDEGGDLLVGVRGKREEEKEKGRAGRSERESVKVGQV